MHLKVMTLVLSEGSKLYVRVNAASQKNDRLNIFQELLCPPLSQMNRHEVFDVFQFED